MNTLEHPLTESHESPMVDAPRISRAASRTPERALTQVARAKPWSFRALVLVMYLGGSVLLAHWLRSSLGNPPLTRQEFEGLGIVLCALAYIGIFLWRLSRAFEREAQQVEVLEKHPENPSTVAAELNTGK